MHSKYTKSERPTCVNAGGALFVVPVGNVLTPTQLS
jgi:hypothetical protein